MAQRGRKPEDFEFSYSQENPKNAPKAHWWASFGSPVIFMVLSATVIVLSGAFFIVSELNNRVSEADAVIQDLEARTDILLAERARLDALLKEQLSKQSATNAGLLKEYEESIQTLQEQVDALSGELRAVISAAPDNSEIRQIDGRIGESRSDLTRLANAVFFVSVFYHNLPQSKLTDVKNTLFAQMGFKAKSIEKSWWAEKPSVFYYSSFSKEKAEEIAATVSIILGVPVEAAVGGGSGISETERKTAIIVHIGL